MQSNSFDTEEVTPLDHHSEEALFDNEVIQDDHELYYIHHYLNEL